MRKSLEGVVRRVEQIGRRVESAGFGDCAATHERVKFSWVETGGEAPPWPEAEAPEQCVCGRDLRYTHLLLSWQPGSECRP